MSRRAKEICALLILSLVVTGMATAATMRPSTTRTVVVYDDFSGGRATYARKWLVFYSLERQFGARNLPAFSGGRLRLLANPFRGWMDTECVPGYAACVNADHVKYNAFSQRAFPMPQIGSIMVTADIEAKTFGIRPGYVVAATGRVLPEAHQAAAVLQLLEPDVKFTMDWFVARRQAIPKIERTLWPLGPMLDRAFTQFLPAISIAPGRSHRFSIRYTRGREPLDKIEWLIDGRVVAIVRDAGVPLDVQDPARYAGITFPSLGPGETVAPEMNQFIVGHGIYSFVDNFPFFPAYQDRFVSIPKEQRIFGQGIDAFFDNVRVETVQG
jgi:hypothetical protein